MTRRDQILRLWIRRPEPGACWLSCVSWRGRLHEKSTGTRHRRAAIEYNELHLRLLLSAPADNSEPSVHQHQLEFKS